MVGSAEFTMHKRAGDSNLATLSASSPVLREKKTAISIGSLSGAFGASDAARSWSRCPAFPVARIRGPAWLRPGDNLMFSLDC